VQAMGEPADPAAFSCADYHIATNAGASFGPSEGCELDDVQHSAHGAPSRLLHRHCDHVRVEDGRCRIWCISITPSGLAPAGVRLAVCRCCDHGTDRCRIAARRREQPPRPSWRGDRFPSSDGWCCASAWPRMRSRPPRGYGRCLWRRTNHRWPAATLRSSAQERPLPCRID
jgi:hypothetical protein